MVTVRPIKNKLALAWFAFSTFLVGGTLMAQMYLRAQFDRGCMDHFHRAAVANTIEMADKELVEGLRYLDQHDLTAGNTAVFYQTPADDIGFWYQNLKSAEETLRRVSKDATQLERTNVLLKLKESIVSPPGDISVYPDQRTWSFVLGLFMLCFIVGFVWTLATLG